MPDKDIKCSMCDDTKKILNPKWEEIWEYYDRQGQFDMNTCCEKADSQTSKYIDCPNCSKN